MAAASSSSSLKATLIVAHDSSRGIGANGGLPWRLSKEMKYFASATTAAPEGKQNAVIMGRTTWQGIPARFRPLKDRINVVLSSKTREDLQLPEHVLQAASLPDAVHQLQNTQSIRDKLHRIFILGGAQLYKSSLQEPEIADRILLTRIVQGDDKWSCDAFFPELSPSEWTQTSTQEHQEWLQGVDVPAGEVEEKDVAWKYEMWVRK